MRGIKRQTVHERPFPTMHDLCDYLKEHYPEARQELTGAPLSGRYLVQFYERNRAVFARPATLEEHRFGWFTELVVVPEGPLSPTVLYHKPDGFADWPEFRRTVRRLQSADRVEVPA